MINQEDKLMIDALSEKEQQEMLKEIKAGNKHYRISRSNYKSAEAYNHAKKLMDTPFVQRAFDMETYLTAICK